MLCSTTIKLQQNSNGNYQTSNWFKHIKSCIETKTPQQAKLNQFLTKLSTPPNNPSVGHDLECQMKSPLKDTLHSVTDDEVQVPSANQAISGSNIHNSETSNSSMPPESSTSAAINTEEGNINRDLHISSVHANEDSQKNNNSVFQ